MFISYTLLFDRHKQSRIIKIRNRTKQVTIKEFYSNSFCVNKNKVLYNFIVFQLSRNIIF